MFRRNLLIALVLFATPALADRDVEHAFQISAAKGSVQRVVIDVPYGSFVVRNGAQASITASGTASRSYNSQGERAWAQKVVDDSSVEIAIDGPTAVVRRKFGPDAKSFRARKFTDFDVELEVPAGTDIVFQSSAGEIRMDGDFGDVDIDLTAGEVNLSMPRASVRELKASCRMGEVRAHLGDRIITREGVFPGRTEFFNPEGRSRVAVHTTFGEVDVTLTTK